MESRKVSLPIKMECWKLFTCQSILYCCKLPSREAKKTGNLQRKHRQPLGNIESDTSIKMSGKMLMSNTNLPKSNNGPTRVQAGSPSNYKLPLLGIWSTELFWKETENTGVSFSINLATAKGSVVTLSKSQ